MLEKWYLYKEIRPFVTLQHQDDVAPLPSVADPGPSSFSHERTVFEEQVPKLSGVEPNIGTKKQNVGKGRGQSGQRGKGQFGGKGKGVGKKSM
ncbi:hypothetical protein PoB_006111300 [Plakobranchus ocellatus]|uniref:Uncharacterized protein n=1 Tax=Plakobranchus ocellatus TaxID=259542 RepID=A0AAV4CRX8_9GAST|nr:hypothetical protein PoB_006111300 [Plakobranchus ocellatus]